MASSQTAVSTADRSKPFIPLTGLATDGWSNDNEATATCFCGAVQKAFPLKAPGYIGSFVCNCYDCHKITASMFASNFLTLDSHTRYIRGEDNITIFKQDKTMFRHGNTMANHFCKSCGTLMYRVGSAWPGQYIMRIGTVDDFNLHDMVLKPTQEFFIKGRVSWHHGIDGQEGFSSCREW